MAVPEQLAVVEELEALDIKIEQLLAIASARKVGDKPIKDLIPR